MATSKNVTGSIQADPQLAEQVYRQGREYHERFPDKETVAWHSGVGPIPALMAGGAQVLMRNPTAGHGQGRSIDRDPLDPFVHEYLSDRLMHMEWYLGDGTYGDGPAFHWNYYNSFVIQPMMLDILKALNEAGFDGQENYELVLKRAQRYAAIQGRLISPEGTYPPIGRSLAYRFGPFHLLSQMALWNTLPEALSPGQVREALCTVVKRQLEAPGIFDENGWLRIGFYGHQPDIGEGYISTGSLYLCSEVFLFLGQDEQGPFWTAPAEDWTQKKIWNENPIPIDKALHE